MFAYLVVNVDVTNPTQYKEYILKVPPSIEKYGGRYLARAGKVESLEGHYTPYRFVIIEFPSYEQAKKWWSSEEYAEAKAIRQANSRTDMMLVEGL